MAGERQQRDAMIRDMKATLRAEGYAADTIEDILNEVRTSFLREDAEDVVSTLRDKAQHLRDLLDTIFDALERERVVDFRIPASRPLEFGPLSDHFDVWISGNQRSGTHGTVFELRIRWLSRSEHACAVPRRISLGEASRASDDPGTSYDMVELASITLRAPGRARSEIRSDRSYLFAVNVSVAEAAEAAGRGGIVECSARKTFQSCLDYLDYMSDMHGYAGYRRIAAEIAEVHRRIAWYFSGKKQMLGSLDLSPDSGQGSGEDSSRSD
jgi:hypothetical protein